ncbi:unnamed protein product [Ixodes hexagonus]
MLYFKENNPVQHATSSDLPETNLTNLRTCAALQTEGLNLTPNSNPSKAGSLFCIPEEASLENFMQAYKERVNKELAAAVSTRDDIEALKETNMVLTVLTKQLLEQNDVLVSSLMDVAREGECRVVQMQKRLRESAQATKDVVLTMSDWGEEIRDLIIGKCQAENLIHEAEISLLALRNENQCLKDYNENLWHDLQSLLHIIREARTSGHWEMGLVTFCEISPEDVFGPICRPSAKQTTDAVLRLRHGSNSTDDLGLVQQPLTEESSHKLGPLDLVIGPQSPTCSSGDNERGILNRTAPSIMAKSLKEHTSAHDESLRLSECGDVTSPMGTTKDLCNEDTKKNEESKGCHSARSVTLEQEQSQCTDDLRKEQDGQPKGPIRRLARSFLGELQESWTEGTSDVHSTPAEPADCKRVLFTPSPLARGLDWSLKTASPKANFAAQTEGPEASSVVMGTQTDVLLEACLPSGNESRDQELGSLRERLNLAIQEAQSKTLLATQLQAHLDASAKQVEHRDRALQNLENKLRSSRKDCDNLKKDVTSLQFDLERAQQTIERERTLRTQYQAQAGRLTLTVQHLREALVSSKRAMEEGRRALKDDAIAHNGPSRVHDV